MYNRYCKTRDDLKLKDADVVRMTGIAQSTFSDWKKGRSEPKIEKLALIAQALNVTLDYLVTGKEIPTEILSKEERDIICVFRELNETGRQEAIKNIHILNRIPEYTQKKASSEGGL